MTRIPSRPIRPREIIQPAPGGVIIRPDFPAPNVVTVASPSVNGLNGIYTFADLPVGTHLQTLRCEPGATLNCPAMTIRVLRHDEDGGVPLNRVPPDGSKPDPTRASKLMQVVAARPELHDEQYVDLAPPALLRIPAGGIRIDVDTPCDVTQLFIFADNYDEGRHSRFELHNTDTPNNGVGWGKVGIWVGGDTARTLIGPIRVPGEIPEGVHPNTRDHQYMVWEKPPPFPDNPHVDKPFHHLFFWPDVALGSTINSAPLRRENQSLLGSVAPSISNFENAGGTGAQVIQVFVTAPNTQRRTAERVRGSIPIGAELAGQRPENVGEVSLGGGPRRGTPIRETAGELTPGGEFDGQRDSFVPGETDNRGEIPGNVRRQQARRVPPRRRN